MPYRAVGRISNANRDFCFGTEGGKLTLYAARAHQNIQITATCGEVSHSATVGLLPGEVFEIEGVTDEADICLTYDGSQLRFSPRWLKNLRYQPLLPPARRPLNVRQWKSFIYSGCILNNTGTQHADLRIII